MSDPNARASAPDGQEQLRILAELSQDFALSLNVDATLEMAVRRIIEHLDAEAASVFLLDAAGEQLECHACAGPVDIHGLTLRVSDGIVGRAVAENACQLVRDVSVDPDFAGNVDDSSGFTTRSMICTPLNINQGVIGAIQVLNKRGGLLFEESDRDMLRVLASPTALAIHNARMAHDLVEQRRIIKELFLARRLQRSLLPERREPPFPLLGLNRPAREVSGDFYDYFEIADGRVAFTIGDVSGKGLDAALLMVRATTLLRWVGKSGVRPGEWLQQVNDELFESISRGMFVCAIAGYYDPQTNRVTWSNAGFPPPMYFPRRGEPAQFQAHGPPLGIDRMHQLDEASLALERGTLYLYSDGMTDVRQQGSAMLGVTGLKELIRKRLRLPPRIQLGNLMGAVRRMGAEDDATLMLLSTHYSEQAVTKKGLARLDFTADPKNLGQVRKMVSDVATEIGCVAGVVDELKLTLNEACANVMRHGYKGDTTGEIRLDVALEDEDLVFRLRDYAEAVDVDQIQPRDLDECRPGGLGINFIDSIMDEWYFETPADGEGNILVMKKRIATAAEQAGEGTA